MPNAIRPINMPQTRAKTAFEMWAFIKHAQTVRKYGNSKDAKVAKAAAKATKFAIERVLKASWAHFGTRPMEVFARVKDGLNAVGIPQAFSTLIHPALRAAGTYIARNLE